MTGEETIKKKFHQCYLCKKDFEYYGMVGIDQLLFCPDCKANRNDEIQKIGLSQTQHWHNCGFPEPHTIKGCGKSNCQYTDICDIWAENNVGREKQ